MVVRAWFSPLVAERRVGHDIGSFLGGPSPRAVRLGSDSWLLLIRRFEGLHPAVPRGPAVASPRFLPDG